jgi:membrane associated rhomboid family serine protease
MRQTHGSMICPNCGKLISVSEKKCPFCGAWQPGLYGYAPALQKLLGARLDLIGLIVTGCVVLYVASLVLQPEAILHLTGLFSILSPGTRALWQLGMTGGLAWEQGWYWTLLTAIYLHGSLLHIFFNVMWIRNLGPAVTEFYGPARAFVIFNVAGAIGFLLSNLMSHSPSIGASGAIFGLLGALIVYGRRVGHAQLTAQTWQWALIMFVMGFIMPSVNNWAHAGGFAGGWLTAQTMRISSERRESNAVMILAFAVLLATLAGFVLSFIAVARILFRM